MAIAAVLAVLAVSPAAPAVNWIPTAEGLEIHFAPYQFGIALPETKTVSWASLADLIAPVMTGITQA